MLVLTVLMMMGMFAVLAFAVDLGYINLVRTELQRSADAAAIAATWELVNEDALRGYDNPLLTRYVVRSTAGQYASLNEVTNQGPALALEDVLIGYMANPFDPTSEIDLISAQPANAVQVRVRKNAAQNGEVPLFFARALGLDATGSEAQATAALLNNIRGFGMPSSGRKPQILPFALDTGTWQAMWAGGGTDFWSWNPNTKTVTSGPDQIREVNLLPQDIGAPGNRGTVDIGSSNNSTADIARQILEGISREDLAYHGGKLELDAGGKLTLNGDTGISAGVKDELASLIGQRRVIPLFSEVSGPGNNAEYTIVGFAGVRIMEVKLTGNVNSKRVIIQPACVFMEGAIPADGSPVSQFVFSPVWLVR